jgi:hypothetical protein
MARCTQYNNIDITETLLKVVLNPITPLPLQQSGVNNYIIQIVCKARGQSLLIELSYFLNISFQVPGDNFKT